MSASFSDLQKIVEELNETLTRAHLQKVHASSDHELLLQFYHRRSFTLYINIQPGFTAAFLTQRSFPKKQPPANIALYLKKHLLQQALQSITLSESRRLLRMQFTHHTLVCALMHTLGNLWVCDPDNKILYAWKPSGQKLGSRFNESLLSEEPSHIGQTQLKAADGASAQIDQLYYQRQLSATQKELKQERQSAVDRQERKLNKLMGELKEAMEAERYADFGKALQSALYQLPKHQLFRNQISVEMDSTTKAIPLPRPMKAYEAMQYYFKLHKKMLRRLQILEQRILQEEQQLARLREAERQPSPAENGSARLPKAPKLPAGIQEHLSPDGFRLWIGKNATANDRLLKLAKGNDLWLHAQDVAGSHCLILREGKATIPQSTILWAARLALKFSKAKGQGDVVIASRSDVRKFKNAKPGEVKVLRREIIHIKV